MRLIEWRWILFLQCRCILNCRPCLRPQKSLRLCSGSPATRRPDGSSSCLVYQMASNIGGSCHKAQRLFNSKSHDIRIVADILFLHRTHFYIHGGIKIVWVLCFSECDNAHLIAYHVPSTCEISRSIQLSSRLVTGSISHACAFLSPEWLFQIFRLFSHLHTLSFTPWIPTSLCS